MKIEIEPIHHEGLDCIQDLIVSVANWLGREYELVFTSFWDFNLKTSNLTDSRLIGDRLLCIEDHDILRNSFERICGISIGNIKYSVDILHEIKQYILDGFPVIVNIDTYYCPWHVGYKQFHTNHYCLITGFNDGAVICIDPSLTLKIQEILNDDFINGTKSYMTLEIAEKTNLQNDYKDILTNSLHKLYQKHTFESIRQFADLFEKYFNYDLEYENFQIHTWNVPIFRNLSYIAGGRILYAKSLEYISNKYDVKELYDIAKEFMIVTSRWLTIKALLTKSYYSKFDSRTKNKVYELIINIADFEQKLAEDLLKILGTSVKESVNSHRYSEYSYAKQYAQREHNFIDLSKYLNNQAFGFNNSNTCTADLTGEGQYFLTEGLPESNYWEVGNMAFCFPKLQDCKPDNISCSNQNIKLPPGKYRSIMLLGCAEWGNFSEYLTINYSQCESEKVFFQFTDWSRPPIFGEIEVWKGTVVQKKEHGTSVLKNFELRLVAKEYYLEGDGDMVSIDLPFCPGIHIFAITLLKRDVTEEVLLL